MTTYYFACSWLTTSMDTIILHVGCSGLIGTKELSSSGSKIQQCGGHMYSLFTFQFHSSK